MTRPEIKIGNYFISNMMDVPTGNKPPYIPVPSLWLESDTGEGMSVPMETLIKFLDELWSGF